MQTTTKTASQQEWLEVASPVLVLGGAYTGKSEFAHRLLSRDAATIVFGTAEILSPEIRSRIDYLKKMRPATWQTSEDNLQLVKRLDSLDPEMRQVMIDSLNQWVAFSLLAKDEKYSPGQMLDIMNDELNQLCRILANLKQRMVIVSSEVGAGVTPPQPLARIFREVAGRFNCRVAEVCKTVVMVVAGIPVAIKSH